MQLGDAVVDLAQPRGERIARARADHAALDERGTSPARRRARRRSRCSPSRIDAEDDHASAMLVIASTFASSATSMSKLRPDLLHVVELLERLDQLEQRLGVLAGDLHGVLRHHRQLGFRRQRCPSPRARSAPCGSRVGLVVTSRLLVLALEVFGAGVERGFHERDPRRSLVRVDVRSGPSSRTSTPPSSACRDCRRRATSCARTSATVRVGLSVIASMISATPPGP